jgi:hypothetical protein
MESTEGYYRREWLNEPGIHGGAHVIATVGIDEDWCEGHRVDASLTISDCNRSVQLDFDLWTGNEGVDEDDRRNGLHKARLLAEIAREFADALELAYADPRVTTPTDAARPAGSRRLVKAIGRRLRR